MDWIQFIRDRVNRGPILEALHLHTGRRCKKGRGKLGPRTSGRRKQHPPRLPSGEQARGALNALWASTLKDGSDPKCLLDYWRPLAICVRRIVIVVLGLLYGCVVGAITISGSPGHLKAALAAVVAADSPPRRLESVPAMVGSWSDLGHGRSLARRLFEAVLLFGLFSTFVALIVVVGAFAFIVLATCRTLWVMPIKRLPGLIPVPWAAQTVTEA